MEDRNASRALDGFRAVSPELIAKANVRACLDLFRCSLFGSYVYGENKITKMTINPRFVLLRNNF